MLGFLFFNFSPAKIFMGDSGSMTIGAITSLLAIWLISSDNSNIIYPLNEIKTPIVAMTILAYPLTDTLRIFALRIFKGLSPFAADRNHIHHCIQRNGFSDRSVVFIILFFNLMMVLTAILTANLDPNLSLLILAVTDVLLVTIMLKIKVKHGVKA
jgi:UDP-N-acetylmuramyl pentapeptide phosphotransferase/UDP-N-acetylglucosamine-1-phosphate transferase